MTDHDQDVLERFDSHMAAVEAEVPAPPPWIAPASRPTRPGRSRRGFADSRPAALAAAVALAIVAGGLWWSVGDHTVPDGDGAALSLPAGLTLESVEPGVQRVVHDGERAISWTGQQLHELAAMNPFPSRESRVHVLSDGRVWLLANGIAVELGEPGGVELEGQVPMTIDDRYAIASDGTMLKSMGWRPSSWDPGGFELWQFRGSEWSAVVLPSDARAATRGHGVAVGPDDTFWFFASHGTYRLEDGDWSRVGDGSPGTRGSSYVVGPDGVPWSMGGSSLFHYLADGEWVAIDPVGTGKAWLDDRVYANVIADMNPDGVIWAHALIQDINQPPYLARYADGEWVSFTDPATVPRDIGDGFNRNLGVAPDGSVWLNPGSGEEGSCEGLARFDGITWAHHLTDLCIYDLDIAPDGRVWATAGPPLGDDSAAGGLYIVDHDDGEPDEQGEDMNLKTPLATALAIASLATPALAQDPDSSGSLVPALVSGQFVPDAAMEVTLDEGRDDAGAGAGYLGTDFDTWSAGGRVEMSDERLVGTYEMLATSQRFRGDSWDEQLADVNWGTLTITNDDGSWEGRRVGTTSLSASSPTALPGISFYELTGSGAYTGLSAVIFEHEAPAEARSPLDGIIFPGDLPPDR